MEVFFEGKKQTTKDNYEKVMHNCPINFRHLF